VGATIGAIEEVVRAAGRSQDDGAVTTEAGKWGRGQAKGQKRNPDASPLSMRTWPPCFRQGSST
jgi:hypothetical protein